MMIPYDPEVKRCGLVGSVDRVGEWVLWQGEWGVDSSVGGVVSLRWSVVIQI